MDGSCSCGFIVPIFSRSKFNNEIKMGGKILDINEYGILPETGDRPGIPARITAQHRDRYEIVCRHGFAYARLKTGAYYGGDEPFPAVGDFVMVQYVENGDSLILSTLCCLSLSLN